MSEVDIQFTDCLVDILNEGQKIETRNDKVLRKTCLKCEFTETPLVQLRKVPWRYALLEFEWFMSGSNNINDLDSRVHHWWKPWVNNEGYIKNNYSRQFKHFVGKSEVEEAIYNLNIDFRYPSGYLYNGFDQINALIHGIKNHPYSRRNVITTWNSSDMWNQETPISNCHGSIIQTFVNSNNTLDIFMYQRSCDMLLGVPANWVQYWAFLLYLCHHTDKKPGKFTWIGGDAHIYNQHIDMAQKIINLDETKNSSKDCFNTESINLIYKPTSKEFKANDFSLDRKYDPIIKEKLQMIV